MAISTYLSIINLNISGLNNPIKRYRVTDWMKKQDPSICCLQKTHFRAEDTHRLIVRGWKKLFHVSGNDKKAGVAILISDKVDFKTKFIKEDKKGHYVVVKGSKQEGDITFINIYAPNIGGPKYIRQILTDRKQEIDCNIIIVGDFNVPLTSMDRSSRQKMKNEKVVLNDILDKLDLIDIYRTFHSKTAEYTSSTLLIIRVMQVKTTIRYQPTPVRMTII